MRLGAERPSALRKIELSRAERRDLHSVALDLRDVVVKQDVERILGHVDSRTGLWCTDSEILYPDIRRDLRDPQSHLFQSLFDTARWSHRCGHEYSSEYPAVSDAELFRDATDTRAITWEERSVPSMRLPRPARSMSARHPGKSICRS